MGSCQRISSRETTWSDTLNYRDRSGHSGDRMGYGTNPGVRETSGETTAVIQVRSNELGSWKWDRKGDHILFNVTVYRMEEVKDGGRPLVLGLGEKVNGSVFHEN